MAYPTANRNPDVGWQSPRYGEGSLANRLANTNQAVSMRSCDFNVLYDVHGHRPGGLSRVFRVMARRLANKHREHRGLPTLPEDPDND